MKIIVLSLLAIMLFINCSSDDSSQEQQCSNELTVELEPPTEVTQTGARLIGVITPPSCDMVITSQGFVYGPSSQPDINDDAKIEVEGEIISTLITDLEPDVTYYVRTYVINSSGTYYSNEKSFKTLNSKYTYVPDNKFEQALINLGYDDNLDNYILTDNISEVTSLSVDEFYIENLTGIEAFIALEELNISFNSLTSLNLSKNTALTALNVAYNKLTSIDLSNNIMLENLDIRSNSDLAVIDVSHNTKLKEFWSTNNEIESLDFSNNPLLEIISANKAGLYSINVTGSPKLKKLLLEENHLGTINLTNNPLLEEVSLGNRLHSFDNNVLSSIDISQNKALKILDISYNRLSSIDISHNSKLEKLDCAGNNLSVLDISQNINLESLVCSANDLSTIDTSQNKFLTTLACSQNNLTVLDVSQNLELRNLYCDVNNLSILDLSLNPLLQKIDCSFNDILELDLSLNNYLQEIYCKKNKLISLNIANGNNNGNMVFDSRFNSNLFCIQVDAGINPQNYYRWEKDKWAVYSTNCE